MLTGHYINLIFLLCIGHDDGLINSERIVCASERESMLGF